MRAVYIKEFGGPENLEIREVPDPPKPSGKEVLVRVRAAGLNRADLLQRKGAYAPPAGFSPNIPGLEFAGEIVGVGEDVQGFGAGDRVMAITAGEAQAEFVAVDSSLLMRIPERLSFAEAAAVPEVFITAHDAIFTLGELRAGQTLLIHAVGSGVGLAGLQMAKAVGAKVVGTSRTAYKLERCAEFGLDDGILVGAAGFADAVRERTAGKGVDVVLELVGGNYLEGDLKSLAVRGNVVLVGLTGGASADLDLRAVLQKRARIIGTVLRPRTTEEKASATRLFAERMLPSFESGSLKPNVDTTFPAEEVRAAHEYLESNLSFGKVILEF